MILFDYQLFRIFFCFLPPSDKNSSLPSSSFLFFSAIISAIGLAPQTLRKQPLKWQQKTKQNHIVAVPKQQHQ
jgi:hypothetical protein